MPSPVWAISGDALTVTGIPDEPDRDSYRLEVRRCHGRFSDPDRAVVIDMAPGRDASAVLFFAGLFSHAERCRVRVVTIDCHAPYRMAARVLFPNAVIVADAFHLHRRVLAALTEVRRDAWNRWRHRNRRFGRVFKNARFALARARDTLQADDSRTGDRQRLALYDAVNLDGELGVACELKEAWPTAMAIGRTGDVTTFTACLELFDALCVGSSERASTPSSSWPRRCASGGPRRSTTRCQAGPATGSPKRSTI